MEMIFVVGYALVVAGVFLICIAMFLDKPTKAPITLTETEE